MTRANSGEVKVGRTINAIMGRPANDEMVEGFRDGLDLNSPEPSANRSHSYRHGFANGRDDRAQKPRASWQRLNEMADAAMALDDAVNGGSP